jgi:adenylate cyclase
MFYYEQRAFAAAIPYFEKSASLSDADFSGPAMLISCYTTLDDREGAVRAARMTQARAEKVVARDPNNGHALAFGAQAHAVLGEGDRFKEWLNRALLVDPDNYLMRYNFACAMSAQLNDAAGALDLLEPVFANISGGLLTAAKTDSDLDCLREEPRFKAMLAAAEARLAAAGDTTG